MESHRCNYYTFLLAVVSVCLLGSSQAHNFYVGGKDGWALKPSKNYNHWAERNRFQVNDSLIFKYKEGSDSVLVVDRDAYNKCNKSKPIHALKSGHSVFKFDRSGPFFFISGRDHRCQHGQKLIVVVMAVRNSTHHDVPSLALPSSSPSPAPDHEADSPDADAPWSSSTTTTPEQAPDVFHAPAPAPSAAPAFGGHYQVGAVMGLSVVLGFFFGLVQF